MLTMFHVCVSTNQVESTSILVKLKALSVEGFKI